MRSKEEAQDYRYFPDPDLPPLRLEEAFVAAVRESMPELPSAKRLRFTSEMGLTPYAAQVLTAHPQVAAFFVEAAAAVRRRGPRGQRDRRQRDPRRQLHPERGVLGDVPVAPDSRADPRERPAGR